MSAEVRPMTADHLRAAATRLREMADNAAGLLNAIADHPGDDPTIRIDQLNTAVAAKMFARAILGDWVDDAPEEEVRARFDGLPKAEVVTDPPATWAQQDKWERRCCDLLIAIGELRTAAQPWREHVAAVLDDGHGLASYTRTLAEALDAFYAKVAKIPAVTS